MNKILFAGMYESGKTTFIAALWDYINSDMAIKNLTLNSLANSENQYLEKIRSEWLQCTKVTRTNLNESETVRMNIINVKSGKNLILEIPDISGELFNSHFQLREWDIDYENIVNQMGGILLFINPKDERNRTKFIADALDIEFELECELGDKTYNEEKGDLENQSESSSVKTIDFITWTEEFTSNQVKLVETLQLISSRIVIQFPIPISVVISRWDLIETNGNKTPLTWLQNNMPLLYQYLICNEDIFKFQIFGVSAQGADYNNENERNRLLSIEPHKRPIVKCGDIFINDITEPIIWLTRN